MAFDAHILHWPTVDAFVAYLAGIPRPDWCHGLTNHNSYVPNELQWRGLASMNSMLATYIGKGWPAGPHLFLAAEAPNSAHRGIWQLTPLAHPGVHAGDCNTDHLGIENVGDFDARPPSASQYQLLLDVNRALLHHWKLRPEQVNVHNECMKRTCPGRHLTGAQIRADLALPPKPKPAPFVGVYRFTAPQAVFTARSPSAPLAAGPADGMTIYQTGDIVEIGDITAGWAWIRTGIGFVPLAVLRGVS